MENSFQRRSATARFIDLAAASMHRMALLGMLLIAACSTTAPHSAPPSQAQSSEPSASPSPPQAPLLDVASAAPAESPLQAFERMRDDVGRESVFFDFDKSDIREDQVSAIMDNAKVAGAYSNDYLTLQGNCDECGSREYNLALAQRRADAVKARLVLLGVPGERIETMSFGKEKPRAQCHNETCWSWNRRADFVHEWK